MSEKDFLVTDVGAELAEFERPTYCIFLPNAKLLDDENVKSALAKLAPLVHAGTPQIKFEIGEPIGSTELTCMDAREFSVASREKLHGDNFLTFAGSGFFLHPKIAAKLRESGHDDLVDALAAILNSAKEKGLKIDILSNHFGEDGGCGGLNFVKSLDKNFEIPDGAAYRKLLVETRAAINADFGNIAKNAKIVMHQTSKPNGTIVESFDLENPDEFARFAENYDGVF
jgi:hypothetical protein